MYVADRAVAPHTFPGLVLISVSLSFVASCSFCASRTFSGLGISEPIFCSVTTALGVKPSTVREGLRIANRMDSLSILVLRSQPGGSGIRIFGS